METIRITYGSDVVIMAWHGAEASAPILADGQHTGYQTADARHRTSAAVRLVCGQQWGTVYETEDDARADGQDPTAVCIWDDVEYEPVEDGAEAEAE